MSLQHAAQRQPTNRLTSSSPLLMVLANSTSVNKFSLVRDLSPALCNVSSCGKSALWIFQDLFNLSQTGPGSAWTLFFTPASASYKFSLSNSKAGWCLQLFEYLACHTLSTCCGTELYQAAQCYTNNNFPFQNSNEGCVLWNCENNALVISHEQPNHTETINKIRCQFILPPHSVLLSPVCSSKLFGSRQHHKS